MLNVIGALTAVSAVAACTAVSADDGRPVAAADSSAAPAPAPAPAPVSGPAGLGLELRSFGDVLAVVRPAPTGPAPGTEALVSGTISVLEGGCLGLSGEGWTTLVVWPSATTFSADGLSLRIPGLGDFRVGDLLTGASGGSTYSTNLTLPTPSERCATYEVALLNEDQP